MSKIFPCLFSVVLLLTPLAQAEVTSVSQLGDVVPNSAYFDSVQSLVERWGVVDDTELQLAALDAGKPSGQPAYFPETNLTNRQLAVLLARTFETLGRYREAGEDMVQTDLDTAKDKGRITAAASDAVMDAYLKDADACLHLTNKAWKTPASADSIKGLTATAVEFEAMKDLVEKYGTGGALLNAGGTYSGTKAVTEQSLTNLLTFVFNLTPGGAGKGPRTLGPVELRPDAKTVSRGKAASLLEFCLDEYRSALADANGAASNSIASAGKPAPKPAAKPAALNLQQIINGLNATPVKYRTGAAELDVESDATLTEIARLVKLLPATSVVEIAVHTDSNGAEAANVKLTQSRAEAVKAALIKRGVPAAMLAAKGWGSAKPRAGNDTDGGRMKNRRTEFNVRTL